MYPKIPNETCTRDCWTFRIFIKGMIAASEAHDNLKIGGLMMGPTDPKILIDYWTQSNGPKTF